MNNTFFSIIVPVYKVEKYIRTCIESIIFQSYSNFELILVDDGSPDSCGQICDEYAEKDPRIIVIHKENGGLMSTWTTALSIVKGEYVGSIDSDDFIEIDMLANIDSVIASFNADIVVYGYKSVTDKGDTGTKNFLSIPEGYYELDKVKTEIIPGFINRGSFENRSNIFLSRVNKFMKRDLLISNSRYYNCSIEYGEDNLWTIPNVLSANSMYVMDYYPYCYRYNPSSITHSFNLGLWDKFCRLDNQIIRILIEKGYKNEIKQVWRDSVFHAAVAINNVIFDSCSEKQKRKQICEIIKNKNVVKGLQHMKKEYCSVKERINMFLMKHNAACTILLLKRVQKTLH